jgi:PAS domain S-box-containing protein
VTDRSPQRSDARRAWLARLAVTFAMILVLTSKAPSTAWLLAIAVAYGLAVVPLLWRSFPRGTERNPPTALQASLIVEALMFTVVLTVLGGLQTSLVGLYGLLVLIGGLAGGSRSALQVGAVAAASYAAALGLQQHLLLPTLELRPPLLQSDVQGTSVLRDFFLWSALVGAMVFATAVFSEQVRERARRAESLYSSLFNAAHEPILVYHPKTLRIVDVNPAMTDVAGRTRDEMIGRVSVDFLPEADRELARQIALHPRHESDTLHRYVRPDGEERVLAASPGRMVESGAAVVTVIKDITDAVRRAEEARRYAEELERKVEERTRDLARVNRKLRDAQDRLATAQHLRAVETLAGSVAHSVNNPLQALLGTIELEIESSRQPNPALHRMRAIAKRIQRVVVSTLDLVRRGSLQLRPEKPGEILSTLHDELRERAEQQGVSIVLKIEPSQQEIHVDRTLLLSALGGIAENALEAMPGGGQMELRLDLEPAASAVCFSISDTGTGIPVDLREKVFEPFFTTKGGGTGLGLAIANGIIQGHQGHIRIDRAPSGGTVVAVRVPTDLLPRIGGPMVDDLDCSEHGE